MNNVAFLYGDIVICWNHIMIVLGIAAGCVYAFVLRPFTLVKKSTMFVWMVLSILLSFFFSRLLYAYCNTDQFFSVKEALRGIFEPQYSVVGLVFGVLLAALIAGFFNRKKCVRKLLDTVFPGVLFALAGIRLSYYFTDTFHSRIPVRNEIFQRLPFAVQMTDAAGNSSWVLAPFLISAIVLILIALVMTFFVRKRIRRTGELFLLTFIFFALSEMVLEGTRHDALRLHFILLKSLNKYVSFICFSMFILGICMVIVFFANYRKAIRQTGRGRNGLALVLFVLGFLCFGICEYLVQRYTTEEVLLHWIQAGFSVLMAVGSVIVVTGRRTGRKKAH